VPTFDTLVKIARSCDQAWLRLWGAETDSVAEALEATRQPLLDALVVELVEIGLSRLLGPSARLSAFSRGASMAAWAIESDAAALRHAAD